eukprot:5050928-Prymnesium_polylepis.2
MPIASWCGGGPIGGCGSWCGCGGGGCCGGCGGCAAAIRPSGGGVIGGTKATRLCSSIGAGAAASAGASLGRGRLGPHSAAWAFCSSIALSPIPP